MKKVFTSILTLFTLPLLAQVTIDQSNYPASASFTDDFSAGAVAGVTVPSVGANQTWDYTGLLETSSFSKSVLDASGNANFPDALNYYQSDLAFQGMVIPTDRYFGVDANGFYEYGRSISDVSYPITAISGGANDVMHFPANDHIYQYVDERVNLLGFPATYQSSWTGTRIEPVDFNLTVTGYGLNNTPGQLIKYWTETREVVGHGSLTIPLPNGDPSAPMEVLLIESSVSLIDSFFLAGSEAPTALLNAFGVTQGNVSTGAALFFYMPDFPMPIIRFGMDGSTISNIGYRPVAASAPTGITANAIENVSIYPNPIAAGASLTINLGESANVVSSIQLIDVTGRTVANQALLAGVNTAQFATPATLVPGVYSIILRNTENAPLKTTRIIVQ